MNKNKTKKKKLIWWILGGLLAVVFTYFYFGKNLTVKEMFVFGFCIYAVFDFTNLAIFRGYRFNLALVVMIWGGILFASTKMFALAYQN